MATSQDFQGHTLYLYFAISLFLELAVDDQGANVVYLMIGVERCHLPFWCHGCGCYLDSPFPYRSAIVQSLTLLLPFYISSLVNRLLAVALIIKRSQLWTALNLVMKLLATFDRTRSLHYWLPWPHWLPWSLLLWSHSFDYPWFGWCYWVRLKNSLN